VDNNKGPSILSRQNLQKFLKAGGLEVLLNCMNLVYVELNVSQAQQQMALEENEDTSDQMNFTRSHSCSSLFQRNSKNICMGILSIKVLDLIFRTMSVVTTNHCIPQPSNREFIHRSETLASLTQMLMLANSDLTREVLSFI